MDTRCSWLECRPDEKVRHHEGETDLREAELAELVEDGSDELGEELLRVHLLLRLDLLAQGPLLLETLSASLEQDLGARLVLVVVLLLPTCRITLIGLS